MYSFGYDDDDDFDDDTDQDDNDGDNDGENDNGQDDSGEGDGYGDDVGDGYGDDENFDIDDEDENDNKENKKDKNNKDENGEVNGEVEGQGNSVKQEEKQFYKDAKQFGATLPVGMVVAGKCPFCKQNSIFKSKKAFDIILKTAILHKDIYYCFNRKCKHSYWRAKYSALPQGIMWTPKSHKNCERTNWLKLF